MNNPNEYIAAIEQRLTEHYEYRGQGPFYLPLQREIDMRFLIELVHHLQQENQSTADLGILLQESNRVLLAENITFKRQLEKSEQRFEELKGLTCAGI